jgi:FkbM family methyltransferase
MEKTVQKNDIKIKIDVESEFENSRFETYFEKEPETITWLETFIQPNDVLYDIGANIGVYSLYPASLYKEQIKVYSFEPAYHNYYKLCRNIIINDFSKTIIPFQLAIGDTTSFTQIDLVSLVEGSANHFIKDSPIETSDTSNVSFTQSIFCVSLDDFIFKHKFETPNHIKIDVDGFELNILKGMTELLKDKKLKSILIGI